MNVTSSLQNCTTFETVDKWFNSFEVIEFDVIEEEK